MILFRRPKAEKFLHLSCDTAEPRSPPVPSEWFIQEGRVELVEETVLCARKTSPVGCRKRSDRVLDFRPGVSAQLVSLCCRCTGRQDALAARDSNPFSQHSSSPVRVPSVRLEQQGSCSLRYFLLFLHQPRISIQTAMQGNNARFTEWFIKI